MKRIIILGVFAFFALCVMSFVNSAAIAAPLQQDPTPTFWWEQVIPANSQDIPLGSSSRYFSYFGNGLTGSGDVKAVVLELAGKTCSGSNNDFVKLLVNFGGSEQQFYSSQTCGGTYRYWWPQNGADYWSTYNQVTAKFPGMPGSGSWNTWGQTSGEIKARFYYGTGIPLSVPIGVFTDGVWLLHYSVPPPEPEEPKCSDNYTLGEALLTDAVDSSSDAGEMMTIPIAPGEFYALEFLSPQWIDNGTSEGSYEADIAVMWPPTPPVADWVHLKEWPDVCIEDLGEDRYRAYFMGDILTDLGFYGIRAHDMETIPNYTNNNGDLNYTLYDAEYTPLASECSSEFSVMALRNTAQIWTDRSGGYPLPLTGPPEPNLWFMLEVTDFPFLDNGLPSKDLEISEDQGINWQDIEAWSYCVNETGYDTKQYYWKSTAGIWPQIRAHDGDGSYWNNEGILNYNLYYAWNFDPGAGNSCSTNFTLGSAIETASVTATDDQGGVIGWSNIVVDNWYAVEITDPVWMDNGSPSLSADITRDPPDQLPWPTWSNVLEWSGAACSELINTNYPRVYFKATSDYYRLRAHDSTGNWGDNSGRVYYKIYNVTAADPEAPPSTCEASYDVGFWVGQGVIYSTLAEGQVINLAANRTYKLETVEGPWYDNGTPRYGVQISADGGSNWSTLENSNIAGISGCVVPLSDGNHIRIYFTTGSGEYRLRVADGNSNFSDNSGTIGYRLYVSQNYDDGDIGNDLPATWDIGCSAICTRPDSVIDVPSWLEYGRCEAMRWVSWCDYHTSALFGVQDMFTSREPFSTILEMKDAFNQIQTEFKTYDWADDMGGFDTSTAPISDATALDQYLPSLPDDSPYNNGKINLMGTGGGGYSTVCQIEMTKATGQKLAAPLCFALNQLNNAGISPWFQFMFDLSLLVILAFYLWRRWIEPGFN